MKDDPIPDPYHIARYCKSTQAPGGQIQPTAFMLRAGEESLSVNCLEMLDRPNTEDQIDQLRMIYATKLKVSAKAWIAVLNVGEVRNKVLIESPDMRSIKVLHNPESGDPSHCGIYNLREDDDLIAELILETVKESYPSRR